MRSSHVPCAPELESRARLAAGGRERAPSRRALGARVVRSARPREFWCSVVSEPVVIRLTRPSHLMRPTGYFVQCNQVDCQYVEANKPPCPLHVDMFAEEIKAAEALRAARREGY